MTKILGPNPQHNIYHARSIHRKDKSLAEGHAVDPHPESFNRILKDALVPRKGSAEIPSDALPLLQQELSRLIAITQNQMNAAFFDAFDDSDEESPLYSDPMDWLDVMSFNHGMDPFVSKIQHPSEQAATPLTPDDINSIIDQAAEAYGIDSGLIQAVIRAESDFDPNCTSSKGAMGLMQLMPETAEDLGVVDAYDPVENIHGGTRYLRSLLDRYEGNVSLTLAAYNWGMGNLERHPERLPRETRTYIARVNRYYQEVKA